DRNVIGVDDIADPHHRSHSGAGFIDAPAIAVCEWQSIRPAEICFPLPSTMTALAGAARCIPTFAILPDSTRRSACSSFPWGPLVQTVAFFMIRCCGCSGSFALPKAPGG